MDVDQLKLMAERSVDDLVAEDDQALRAWIDQAFGTSETAVIAAHGGGDVPHLSLSVDDQFGLVLEFGARLQRRSDDARVGVMTRRLFLDRHVAAHTALVVDRRFRNAGIGTALFASSLRLYDELGIERVLLMAGFDLGRWHWARLGFDFARIESQAQVIAHARRVIDQLSLDVLVTDDASPAEIEGLRSSSSVTLRQAAMASDTSDRERVLIEAGKNGIGLDDAMPLGKALLLTGPAWHGELFVQGSGRAAADAYIAARRETSP